MTVSLTKNITVDMGDDTWTTRKAGDHPQVERAFAVGTGYAWGHQDATKVYDTFAACRFAHAYAEHVRRFHADEHFMHHNVGRAYELFTTHNLIPA